MSRIQIERPKRESDSTWLIDLVAECLDVPACEIDRGVPLVRYGLDSMSAVHLTAMIRDELHCDVPEWLLLDHPDINSLEQFVQASRMTTLPPPALSPAPIKNGSEVRQSTPHSPQPSPPAGGEGRVRGAAEPRQISTPLLLGTVPRNGSGSSLQQMLADSILPDDVRPDRAATNSTAVQSILLTGATGFLGAYLLRSLLRSTRARVWCLVRPDEHIDDQTRIRENLEVYGLWEPSFESRVYPIAGDLVQPQLGLSSDQFNILCRETDSIFHCAASVNWVFPYAALRDINVLGTLEMLRLACRNKAKRFHFVSSMAVCYSTSGPPEVSERDDMLPYLSGIHLGYAQSKCVAETLVLRANERGLPVAIYRPSLICGDGESGVSNTIDFLANVIKGCVCMGSAPDLDWSLDCCPVDHVADAIVGLSGLSCDSPRVYHLANPSDRHWRELILWMNLFGYPIKLQPYPDWLSQLQAESTEPEHPLHTLRGFFLTRPIDRTGPTLPELYENRTRSRVSANRSRKSLSALSLRCPELSAQLLDRYFDSFIERGFLPPVPACRDVARRIPAANRLNHDFFQDLLRRFYADETIRIRELSTLSHPSQDSIITELTSWRDGTAAGLSRHRIHIDTDNASIPQSLELFVKVKPNDQHVLDVGERVATLCSEKVGQLFRRFKHRFCASGCHVRELAIYDQQDIRFRRHAPRVFATVRDDERAESILVLESLSGTELMDSAADVSGWQQLHFDSAVHGIAEFHAIWYRREQELLAQLWLGHSMAASEMAEMKDLWTVLADHAAGYFSNAIGCDIRPLQQELISTVGQWWQSLETMPRTLIHNDFNPRNITFKRTESGVRLCAFDWELATLGVPQHDLAELLCFTITPDHSKNDVLRLLELHRQTLQQATGRFIDAELWRLGFQLSLSDLILNRFPMYCLVHKFRRQPFLDRVIKSWRRLYEFMAVDLALAFGSPTSLPWL
jgi:thioester reductase-like protein